MAARALLRLAAGAGIATEPLTRGLSFDEASLRRVRRVSWDDYCIVAERLEVEAGGPEALEALAEQAYHEAIIDEARTVLRAIVSPRALYRFVFTVVNPPAFPNVDFEYRELPDGRIRIGGRIRSYSRGCLAFQHGNVGAIRGFPAHLDLPPAELAIEEMTERALVVLVRPPASETLVARAQRGSSAAVRSAAMRLLRYFAEDSRQRSDSLASLLEQRPRAVDHDLLARLQRVSTELVLTPRQTEVLALLVRGMSNKEISASLDCAENTVELHVTQLLKKSGVQGRAQLIARFWTDALDANA